MLNAIDFNAVRLAAAVLFLLTSVAVWVVLNRQHDRTAVALWALGGLGLSLAMLARVDKDLQVQSVMWVCSSCAATCAIVFRVVALRRDLGLKMGIWPAVALCVAMSAPVAALTAWGSASAAVLYVRVSHGFLVGVLAFYAWQLGRRGPSRNGLELAAVEALTLLGYLLISFQLLTHWDEGLALDRWDYAVFSLVTVINAAYSNLAYVGLVLDRSRVAEKSARIAQAEEAARRETAEAGASALRTMLHERDRLATERGHLLQVLAHEIRQPLHNVNAALQVAAQTLRKTTPHSGQACAPAQAGADTAGLAFAAERVQHAQQVLGDMQSVLENTLAVSSLLVRDTSLTMQEVEIDFLLDLALGDLSDAERSRVELLRRSELRIVEVDPGLVRLALRNLLRNAFSHGGPAVTVSLGIEEQMDPPAWVLSVEDGGVGMSAEQLKVLTAGAPADAPTSSAGVAPAPQRGAGLFIVRRVMALHQGKLKLAAAHPHGLRARLVFPLPDDEPLDGPQDGPAAGAVHNLTSGARNT